VNDLAGIRLPHERPAKHRLPCPQCEKVRHDDALEVTVTPRRWAFWRCFRCGLEGRAPLDGDTHHHHRERHHPRLEPQPEAPRPSGLTAGAKRLLAGCKPITKNLFECISACPPHLSAAARASRFGAGARGWGDRCGRKRTGCGTSRA
jgi:hypothetical protein